MTRTIVSRFRQSVLVGSAVAALAGCSSGPRVEAGAAPPPPSTSTPASAGWTGREDVGRAIQLLEHGEAEQARAVLAEVLNRQPNDPIAADLARQIDSDPVALLGQKNFAYVAREGDTLSSLAGRYLGNPTRFYALGRYNALSFPAAIRPGQALRIPGEFKVARSPAALGRPKPAAAKQVAPAPAPAVAAKAPAPEPGRAAKLRAAALEQLNRGAIDRAIGLLRQADQLAPGNPLVQRDLDRALRIQRAVQSRG